MSTPPVDDGWHERDARVADADRAAPRRSGACRPPAQRGRASARCRPPGRRRGAGRARAWPGTCPTGVSGPSGASSSTWPSPTSSSTASTPCSSTVSRCTSCMPEGLAVERERGVEVLDGDADVVDPAEHAARRSLARPSGARRSRGGRPACAADAQARAGGRSRARRRAIMRSIVGALEHLVAQQRVGELVELARGARMSSASAARWASSARSRCSSSRMRRVGLGRHRGRRRSSGASVSSVPIAYSWTIAAAISATRLRSSEAPVVIDAEHELLRRAAAEQHRHVVDQLLARLQVAVLLREVERVAERARRAGRSRSCARGRPPAAARRTARARPRGRRRPASRGR